MSTEAKKRIEALRSHFANVLRTIDKVIVFFVPLPGEVIPRREPDWPTILDLFSTLSSQYRILEVEIVKNDTGLSYLVIVPSSDLALDHLRFIPNLMKTSLGPEIELEDKRLFSLSDGIVLPPEKESQRAEIYATALSAIRDIIKQLKSKIVEYRKNLCLHVKGIDIKDIMTTPAIDPLISNKRKERVINIFKSIESGGSVFLHANPDSTAPNTLDSPVVCPSPDDSALTLSQKRRRIQEAWRISGSSDVFKGFEIKTGTAQIVFPPQLHDPDSIPRLLEPVLATRRHSVTASEANATAHHANR